MLCSRSKAFCISSSFCSLMIRLSWQWWEMFISLEYFWMVKLWCYLWAVDAALTRQGCIAIFNHSAWRAGHLPSHLWFPQSPLATFNLFNPLFCWRQWLPASACLEAWEQDKVTKWQWDKHYWEAVVCILRTAVNQSDGERQISDASTERWMCMLGSTYSCKMQLLFIYSQW